MKHTKYILTAVLLLTATVSSSAKDSNTFTAVNSEGITVLYQIISESNMTVRVGAQAIYVGDDIYTQAIDQDITGKVTIPAEVNGYQVVELGYGAFFWRSGITEVVLPEGLETICNAFYQNSSLRRVNIPSTVTTFKTPFTCCFALEYIDVPEGITEVMQEQFNNTGLKGVHLPSTITSIGSKSFFYANYLSGVFLDAPTPPTLHEEAFPTSHYINFYDSTYVFVPAESVAAYQHADVWSNFQHIQAPYATGDTFKWKDKSGLEFEFLVTSATDRTVQLGTGSNPTISPAYIGNVTIPTYARGYRVASFAPNAFEGCTGIAAVTANFDYPMAFPASAFPASVYTNGYLYIPEDLRPRYAALEGWSEFQQVNPGNFAQWETFLAVNPEGIEIAYTVTDAEKKYVRVQDDQDVRGDKNTYRALDKNTEGHVTIPDCVLGYKVTEIGTEAFMECSKITSVRLPESVKSIGHEAFSYCTSMTSINMPSALETIKQWAFWGCRSLGSLDIPHGVTTIEEEAFKGCSGLGDLVLPSTLTTFEPSAFIGCTGLTSLRVEAGGAFDSRDGCNALIRTATNTLELGTQNTVIPTSVTAIGSNAFAGFKSFTEVDVPAWITSIGSGAYKNCSNVKRVTLHDAVAIDDNAFSGLPSDSRVYIFSDDMPTCSASSFPAQSTLYVPIGRRADYQAATGWSGFSTIKEMYPLGTETFTVKTAEDVDLTLKITDPYELKTQVGDGTNVAINAATTGTLTIPVTAGDYTCPTIATNAFKDCTGMTEVIIPDGINAIESQAFAGCTALTTVTCQATAAYPIADDAFDAATYSDATLKVGLDLENAYSTTDGWKQFAHIGEPMDLTGITSFTAPTIEGVAMTFTVIDAEARTVKVGAENDGRAVAQGTSGAVTIPATIRKCNVVEIGAGAFRSCYYITSIVIPESITAIGDKAFYTNNAMTLMDVKREAPCAVGAGNFGGYSSRTVLHVPSGCKAAYQAADSWKNFKRITDGTIFPETTETFTATTKEGIELTFKITDRQKLEAEVIDHSPLTIDHSTLTIPAEAEAYAVTAIAEGALSGCSQLKEVVIPSSITSIGSRAFSYCTALELVTCWAAAAYAIPNDAFDVYTYSQAELLVDNTLTETFAETEGWKLFTHVDVAPIDLTEITSFTAPTIEGVPVTYTVIDPVERTVKVGAEDGGLAINKNTKGAVTIPASVRKCKVVEIGAGAFESCWNLTSVVIPEGVTTIGNNAFRYCSYLTDCNIPEGIVSIGEEAFNGCSKLTSITIPDGVVSIGEGAFESCKLTMLTIPASVETIGNYAFFYNNNLTLVDVKRETPVAIGFSTFFSSDAAKAVLHVPAGCKAAYQAAEYWKNFKRITDGTIFPEATETFTATTKEGIELTFKITDRQKLEAEVIGHTPMTNEQTTLTIPAEAEAYAVTAIAEETFKDCAGLTEVVIPDGVSSIGSQAFSGCTSIEKVTCWATAVYDIPDDAFDADTYNQAELVVVNDFLDDFAAAEGWKLFVNKKGVLKAGDGITAPTVEGVEVTYTVKDPMEKTAMVGGQPYEYDWRLAAAINEYASIATLTIPGEVNGYKVVAIANDAFRYISGLSAVTIPSTVTEIGSNAFAYTGIANLTVGATTPPTIADNTFTNSYKATLCVPFGSRAAYRADANWNQFTTIIETGSDVEGDANNDGQVTITDAVSVVDYILGNPSVDFKTEQADINKDGVITITDAVGVVDMILNQK